MPVALSLVQQGGCVEVIPKMYNIRHNPTVVVDASDSQLHHYYTIGLRES
jgi:hypothetical protein